MIRKNTILTALILGLVCTGIACTAILKSEKEIKSVTETVTETTHATPASTEEIQQPSCAILGEKTKGTGTKTLVNRVFYFDDYTGEDTSAIEEACAYAENSADDYFLSYERDRSTNQIVAIKFEKATAELEQKYGSATE